MKQKTEQTIKYLKSVVLALEACGLKLLTYFHGKVEKLIDSDFGEFDDLVKKEYITTRKAIEQRKKILT